MHTLNELEWSQSCHILSSLWVVLFICNNMGALRGPFRARNQGKQNKYYQVYITMTVYKIPVSSTYHYQAKTDPLSRNCIYLHDIPTGY